MIKKLVLIIFVMTFSIMLVDSSVSAVNVVDVPGTNVTIVTDNCNNGFLGFPAWYRGLTDSSCNIETPSGENGLSNFIWHVVLNVIEMALVMVGYISAFFILYGGFQFVTSQGSSDGSAKARTTIMNAVIGLVLSLMAAAIVGYVVGNILQ
jgi:hypothetical protein